MSEPNAKRRSTLGQAAGESVGGRGSDVESGLSFAPALRPHQRTQRRNGADRCQQNKTGNKKKSTLHVLHRERYHDSPPMLQLYHFNQFANRNHNAMIPRAFFSEDERSIEDRVASIHERWYRTSPVKLEPDEGQFGLSA